MDGAHHRIEEAAHHEVEDDGRSGQEAIDKEHDPENGHPGHAERTRRDGRLGESDGSPVLLAQKVPGWHRHETWTDSLAVLGADANHHGITYVLGQLASESRVWKEGDGGVEYRFHHHRGLIERAVWV